MNSSLLRFIFFISFFTLFSLIEALLPRKQRLYKRIYRWPGNFSILISGTIAAGFIPFLLPAAAAVDAAEKVSAFLMLSACRAHSHFYSHSLFLTLLSIFSTEYFTSSPFYGEFTGCITWIKTLMHHLH